MDSWKWRSKKGKGWSHRFRSLKSETVMEWLGLINIGPWWNNGNIQKCQKDHKVKRELVCNQNSGSDEWCRWRNKRRDSKLSTPGQKKGGSGWTYFLPRRSFLRTETRHTHTLSWRSVTLKAFQNYEERDELVKQNLKILII